MRVPSLDTSHVSTSQIAIPAVAMSAPAAFMAAVTPAEQRGLFVERDGHAGLRRSALSHSATIGGSGSSTASGPGTLAAARAACGGLLAGAADIAGRSATAWRHVPSRHRSAPARRGPALSPWLRSSSTPSWARSRCSRLIDHAGVGEAGAGGERRFDGGLGEFEHAWAPARADRTVLRARSRRASGPCVPSLTRAIFDSFATSSSATASTSSRR